VGLWVGYVITKRGWLWPGFGLGLRGGFMGWIRHNETGLVMAWFRPRDTGWFWVGYVAGGGGRSTRVWKLFYERKLDDDQISTLKACIITMLCQNSEPCTWVDPAVGRLLHTRNLNKTAAQAQRVRIHVLTGGARSRGRKLNP
jgi:hypothetical protein